MLKQKQVELELLEVKLAQKSVTVAQERENNMAERQCVSVTTACQLLIVATNVGKCQYRDFMTSCNTDVLRICVQLIEC